jgi:hypothetical protein
MRDVFSITKDNLNALENKLLGQFLFSTDKTNEFI